ncbi:MAG: M28 family peptidase [Flavobacteriales bacterium]
MKRLPALLLLCSVGSLHAQVVSNISCTSPTAEQVMKGQYDPTTFAASTVIDDHEVILYEMRWLLRADSLKSYLERMSQFGTRNSYSDTLSASTGIGAARRWAHSKFQQFSAANENRLLPTYLQFDQTGAECGDTQGWRNVLAVLPGSDTSNASIVLIEAHLDSRCADNCDVTCPAPGMEDNGSGSALVLELARVMSRYTFKHTIVFMLTTAEEHGLVGADAMAQWCMDNNVAIKGVQNNDIVGGVLCGNTASPPSCETPGSIDSMQVRLFSQGALAAPHRGFARSVKMWYEEKLQDQVAVPMAISVMNQEDRDGRGGDHIPFRQRGYRNLRFTSANENGDANVADTNYTDHQHTSDDVLGMDTNGDQVLDSFFVDFNYLQRNALINGMGATMLALGPEVPHIIVHDEPTGLRVEVDGGFAPEYRIGVRTDNLIQPFIAVYRTSATSFAIPGLAANDTYFISAAAIDANGVMGPFSPEQNKGNDIDTPPGTMDDFPYGLDCWGIGISEQDEGMALSARLLPCRPDPFAYSTRMVVEVAPGFVHREAYILLHDAQAHAIARVPLQLRPGLNEAQYVHKRGPGLFTYSLIVDGRALDTKSLVVTE